MRGLPPDWDAWTVCDGSSFADNALRLRARAPEERRLQHQLQSQHHDRRGREGQRYLPPKAALTSLGSDEDAFASQSAASALRIMLLLHGRRPNSGTELYTPQDHEEPSHASAHGAWRLKSLLDKTAIYAIKLQKLHILRAWLEVHGPGSADFMDAKSCTALHYAVLAPFPEAIDLLLEKGANIDARLPNGQTPLMLATIKANLATIKRLLAAGADPNIPDTDGHTPLMVASRAGYVVAVANLLASGASIESKDTQKRTALWYACKYEQSGVAMILRQARAKRPTERVPAAADENADPRKAARLAIPPRFVRRARSSGSRLCTV